MHHTTTPSIELLERACRLVDPSLRKHGEDAALLVEGGHLGRCVVDVGDILVVVRVDIAERAGQDEVIEEDSLCSW